MYKVTRKDKTTQVYEWYKDICKKKKKKKKKEKELKSLIYTAKILEQN